MIIKSQNCYIPTGSYTSPEHLVSAMMNALPRQVLNYLRFSVTDSGHLKITSFNYRYFNVSFFSDKQALGQMLGLQDDIDIGVDLPESPSILYNGIELASNLTLGDGQISHYIPKYPIDINRGIYGFYIYCDIIMPENTGNMKTNLLRVVPINTDNLLVFNFSKTPHYKPLCMKYITKVQIVIKTDADEDINFPSDSKTLCKLHFKKK